MSQEDTPIRRLKWGTASLIARSPVTPIVLPVVHHGFDKVMLLIRAANFWVWERRFSCSVRWSPFHLPTHTYGQK